MGSKIAIPWYVKIAAKLLLSRIPIDYGFWRNRSLFKHGDMAKPEYAYRVFKQHFKQNNISQKKNCVVLELGPGDSLFSALIANAHGISKIYLVDAGKFAIDDVSDYIQMAVYLRNIGCVPPEFNESTPIEDILNQCNATYMTNGINSLKAIPDNSVDVIWSQAVLDHVKLSDFTILIKEFRRIVRTNGICSHCIDLRDHLSSSLNHLRFSNRLWEAEFMSKSGFYTNRLRYHEIVKLFEKAGFSSKITNIQKWDKPPISKSKFSDHYKSMSDEELSISVFDIVSKPK